MVYPHFCGEFRLAILQLKEWRTKYMVTSIRWKTQGKILTIPPISSLFYLRSPNFLSKMSQNQKWKKVHYLSYRTTINRPPWHAHISHHSPELPVFHRNKTAPSFPCPSSASVTDRFLFTSPTSCKASASLTAWLPRPLTGCVLFRSSAFQPEPQARHCHVSQNWTTSRVSDAALRRTTL